MRESQELLLRQLHIIRVTPNLQQSYLRVAFQYLHDHIKNFERALWNDREPWLEEHLLNNPQVRLRSMETGGIRATIMIIIPIVSLWLFWTFVHGVWDFILVFVEIGTSVYVLVTISVLGFLGAIIQLIRYPVLVNVRWIRDRDLYSIGV